MEILKKNKKHWNILFKQKDVLKTSQCEATTSKGSRCRRITKAKYCFQHKKLLEQKIIHNEKKKKHTIMHIIFFLKKCFYFFDINLKYLTHA